MTVECIAHFWIPLADGTHLAARMWWPEERATPLPALLEYLPYRKSDGTAIGDPVRHAWFAAHGFASLRVDLRGSGDSDGLLQDEYHPQELADGEAVIAWLARQPWCNGRVGLFGISWGGFNALQIAARQPPALRAIVSACSTDDRYADDVHYLGGGVQAQDALVWATQFTTLQAMPPSQSARPDDWYDEWLHRLDAIPHFAARWLEHPLRDDYWQHGSVATDYSAIRCPVLLVGGWQDAYTNAIPRLAKGLTTDCRVLIGPWPHSWPDGGRPGPTIAWHRECVDWFTRWLKDDNDESSPASTARLPDVLVYEQDWTAPGELPRERAGRWVGLARWPSEQRQQRYWIDAAGLVAEAPVRVKPMVVSPALQHGMGGGQWCPFGARADIPADQRQDNEQALCLHGPTARTEEHLFGVPRLRLTLCADRPRAQLVVRLCDVAPDGSALLVARGVHALRHTADHREARDLVIDEDIDVALDLDVSAHRLRAGHHWLLAIATSYWPMLWPSPELARLTVRSGTLDLPMLPADAETIDRDALGVGDGAAALTAEWHRAPRVHRELQIDDASCTISRHSDGGAVVYPDGTVLDQQSVETWRIDLAAPTSAEVTAQRSMRRSENGNEVVVEVTARMRSDATHFIVAQQLRATCAGEPVAERHFHARLPRGD